MSDPFSARAARALNGSPVGNAMKTANVCLVALTFAATARAADWPQWLGPHRDGSSQETVAPWKETPTILWKQPVGEGHSSPVVADGKVYVFSKVKDKNEELLEAIDAKTGERLWQQTY